MRRRLSPRWAFFTFAVLALLALNLWLRYTEPTPTPLAVAPEPRPSSVAVLPFVNASPDSADDYFSDGVTEELTSALGRVPGLRVADPTSAFTLKRPGEDPPGRRPTAQGEHRPRGQRPPAQRPPTPLGPPGERERGVRSLERYYERSPSEILAVQDEILRSVVARLRVPGAERWADSVRPPSNLEAYLAYLRARHALTRRPGATRPMRRLSTRRPSGWTRASPLPGRVSPPRRCSAP